MNINNIKIKVEVSIDKVFEDADILIQTENHTIILLDTENLTHTQFLNFSDFKKYLNFSDEDFARMYNEDKRINVFKPAIEKEFKIKIKSILIGWH